MVGTARLPTLPWACQSQMTANSDVSVRYYEFSPSPTLLIEGGRRPGMGWDDDGRYYKRSHCNKSYGPFANEQPNSNHKPEFDEKQHGIIN
ncbi:hypothetical protein UCREL1_11191 [Eutypa lata UCREL1]|uniref:Uncharacterized protein n=1 Tax=Eutypa lata (strain UCR-EL1) TaxID=1287681 RepID=M7S716_EUTLA|nr:hypothetical protein UCREL1_11191 [Eutypa lata UCREL1]